MRSEHYDAIVVGAGPAGASAAYELARTGLRTLLIEKERLPRYKTCGGGITYKAARALPFDISPVVERTLSKIEFSWKTGRTYTLNSATPLVYMVQRSRFDNYLTEKAAGEGAKLMDQTPVKSVEADEHGAAVSTVRGTFTADYLIGADGARGRVAHSVGLMQDRWALAALESEVEVEDEIMAHWHDKFGIDLGELRASYGWVFPKGDHLSVGVGGLATADGYGRLLRSYDEKHTNARVPGITRTIRSHGYLLPCRRLGAAVQKGRVLLVGDAAGLVEPFTGEGIYWAIRSGQLAAKSIVAGGSELCYQQQLDALLMPDLFAARRWWSVYISLPRACYLLPKYVPPFWGAVCNIIRGSRRYVNIKERLGPLGVIEGLLPDPSPLQRV